MHTYSWDADGNSITVDSVGATYDALDRIVELNRSGSLWCTILFMRPTFYRVTGMRNCALDRIAGHSVLGFPSNNPTHKKYVLYDFRVLWQSPRSFDTVEVWGSSPHGPTIFSSDLASTTSIRKAPNGST